MKESTKEIFEKRFYKSPLLDDLERVNCNRVGEIGHQFCGVCRKHKQPRFMCGCIKKLKECKHDRANSNSSI